MSANDDFDFGTEDVQPRDPDRSGDPINWRLVVLIVVGFSAIQILWLLALGWRA